MTHRAKKGETFTVAVLAPPAAEFLTFYIYNKRLKFAQKLPLSTEEFAAQVKILETSVEEHLQSLVDSLVGGPTQGFGWPEDPKHRGSAGTGEGKGKIVHSMPRPKLGYYDGYEAMEDAD